MNLDEAQNKRRADWRRDCGGILKKGIDRDIIQQFQRGKSGVDIAIRMMIPVSRVMATINAHLAQQSEAAK